MKSQTAWKQRAASMLVAGTALALSACFGGGSGGGTQFVAAPPPPPPPPPAPPPPPTGQAPVVIFAKPTVGEYARVGATTNLGDPTATKDWKMTSISLDSSTTPRIRYTSNGLYEVRLTGGEGSDFFGTLIHNRSIVNPTSDNQSFEVPSQGGVFTISGSRHKGYEYSEAASWARPDFDFAYTLDTGYVAFGTATPTGFVPVTGSASYNGHVVGLTDVMQFDNLAGDYFPTHADGTVTLNFDFAAATLGGEMALFLQGGMNPIGIGTFRFDETIFSVGHAEYAGKFDTDLGRGNYFFGILTGPNAEETIGQWTVPFNYEGASHQALGVWIAKRGP